MSHAKIKIKISNIKHRVHNWCNFTCEVGVRLFVIRDSSKLAIFYSYKICKRCKWTYSSFNIRVNLLTKRFFWRNQRTRITTNRV